jgi:hypothetical protein
MFQIRHDHPLTQSLEEHGSHNDIHDIIDASHKDIEALKFKDGQGKNVIYLSKHHKYMIHLLKAYHHWWCIGWDNPIGNDWLEVDYFSGM